MSKLLSKIKLRYKTFIYTGIRLRVLLQYKQRLAALFIYIENAFLPRLTLEFYPETPTKHHGLFYVCLAANIKRKAFSRFHKPDARIMFHDATVSSSDISEIYLNSKHQANIINTQCLDIRKSAIDKIHQDVFGYGLCLKEEDIENSQDAVFCIKSEKNAVHDGRVVSKEDALQAIDDNSVVVQKYVNTKTNFEEKSFFEDLRVGFSDGKIIFVLRKLRYEKYGLQPSNRHILLVEPNEVLSEIEIEKITKFGLLNELDYGEFDILRDKINEKIYICDVSRTAMRLPYRFNFKDNCRVYRLQAKALRSLISMER